MQAAAPWEIVGKPKFKMGRRSSHLPTKVTNTNPIQVPNPLKCLTCLQLLMANLLVQVELKVMELLGGAEALPEDILRILK